MADIIAAKNVVKRYARHTALNGVSINVPEGSIYGLLGPNGAGKTSLIRIINQITAPDEGEIFFENERLAQGHIEKIGYLPEERGLYKKMKVGEQAIYLARLKGMSEADAKSKLQQWFEKFDMSGWWNKKVEELSKGMQQKVQFIVTVLHEPKLLILDEPFSGFDPINVELIKGELLRLKQTGATILLSTHNMASVEELCDFITLIHQSKVVLQGGVSELRHRFKENIWEIKFSDAGNEIENMLNSEYKLLSIIENGGKVARIKAPENSSPNELLGALLPLGTITGFSEILPTMSEIFITAVKG